MKKMLFIINPRSGKEQIRSRLLEILDSFVKAGYGPSVYITQGPKDAEYQAARAKTKELVVCSGGDGAPFNSFLNSFDSFHHRGHGGRRGFKVLIHR